MIGALLLSFANDHALPDDAVARKRIVSSLPVFVGTAFLTKTGDALLNPKITLTWLMQLLGAHPAAIALLVPLRESLSMLPQILLARLVNNRARVAVLFRIGAVLQAVAVMCMAFIATTMDGARAGWFLLAAMAGFSLARCLCSLVSKAIMAKLMPKGLRGQTGGWAASAAGMSTILIASWILWFGGRSLSVSIATGLLLGASVMWLLASVLYRRLDEPSVEPDAARTTTLAERLSLLADDADFRRFVLTRSLLLSSALVAPYYLLLGGRDDQQLQVLAGLLLASGLASLVSGPLWGWFSDISSRNVLIGAAFGVVVLGAMTLCISLVVPDWLRLPWTLPILYFMLEIAHQGIRIGRKTYVVDLAEDSERVDFVAVSNSAIGVILLLTGLATSLLTLVLTPAMMIALLSVMTLGGALMGFSLPDVEHGTDN